MSDGRHERWRTSPLWNINFAQRALGDIGAHAEHVQPPQYIKTKLTQRRREHRI